MWSGRFRGPLNPEFERWQRSFPFDQRLLADELAASAAHARALAKAGVLTSSELEQLLGGLKAIGDDAQFPIVDDEAEDVHHYVEKQLVSRVGSVGQKLHTGRSRNEQIATDLRLFVRRNCDSLIAQLAEFATSIIDKAEASGDSAMPAYTHLQRAEPVLVGHWLLAYAQMFMRDASRLADCRARLNVCPLGSGAVAGATLAIDREMIARELKFSAPTANSMDATSDRDFAIEFAQAASVLSLHLSRWAEEFILFSTQEYAFVQLPESYATGSSAMPQKQNPDALELIRGKAGRITGTAERLQMTLKGLPMAYNKDMQETQEPVFEVAETCSMMLKVATGFMREVDFNYERMQRSAETGFMNSMAGATYLVSKGVPFRKAHEFIATAVRRCVERGCELDGLSLDELKSIAPEFEGDFYASIRLRAVLDCHDVAGGTATSRVREALARAREQVQTLAGESYVCA